MGLHGQCPRHTSSGAANGSAIKVATPTLINGLQSVAMDGAGKFTVVWDDNASGTSFVYAQRFKASGQKNGSLITVASLTSQQDLVWMSSVATANDGRFAVAWVRRVSATADSVQEFQLFNADGSRSGAVREVTHGTGVEAPVGIAYDVAGNVTLAWTNIRKAVPPGSPPGTSYGYEGHGEVRMKRLTAAGTLTPETIVNTTTQGRQFNPGVAATGNGTFVVTWQGNGAGDAAGIFSQRYGAQPHIGSFSANSYSVPAGTDVTLTASDITDANPAPPSPRSTYVDTNNNGVLDSADAVLTGTSTYSNGTWTSRSPRPAGRPAPTNCSPGPWTAMACSATRWLSISS